MKKLLLLSLLLLLNACATSRNYTKVSDTFVQIQPSHDTLIAHNHTLDSVRITTDTRYRFGSEFTSPWSEGRVPLRQCFPAEGTAGSEGRAWGEGRRGTAIERLNITCEARPTRVDTLVTTQVVEHYRIQHDTIRSVHRDTIPIIRTQEVVREVPKPVPRFYKWCTGLFITLVILFLARIAIRFYLLR